MKAEIRNLSCSKELVEQYSFYWNHGEWAFFTIDSKKCLFACDSSFGNYAYAGWDSHNGTFKEFLASLRNDKWYVLGKISEKVFDLDATIEAWKNRIIEWRRNHKDYRDPVSKDEAREMWDLIKMASVSNESEFY